MKNDHENERQIVLPRLRCRVPGDAGAGGGCSVGEAVNEHTYLITSSMRNNYLAIFEELRDMGSQDQSVLMAWWMNNGFLIDQSIAELKSLQSEEEIKEIEER